MTDTPSRDDQPAMASVSQRIKPWSREIDAWRWNRRLTQRYVNTIFRARSAAVMPVSMRSRIHAMGIPPDIVNETLREVRRLDQWTDAWIETAQRFLGDYRRQISGSQRTDAAQARLLAGLCYHIAQLAPGPDQRTLEHCQATAATLVRQALPDVLPHARRLDIPWRNHTLPAILIPGPDQREPSGLVVVFNGTSTTKEELVRWVGSLGKAGLSTLLVDTPGTGEARHLGPPSADHVDLMDGVFDQLRNYHAIDIHKVGLLGVSLGGNIALRCLAHDRRITGAALVTPPFEPSRWIGRASPLIQAELARLFQTGDPAELDRLAASFSLAEVAPHVQRPTLILGGGRDLVIPPAESTRLAAALGPLSTLVWYAEGGHSLYGQIAAWTTDAGYWLDAVQRRQSTRVDDMEMLVTEWRKALYQKPEPEVEWDDSVESARLLTPEEAARARETAQQPPLDDEYSRAFDDRLDHPRGRRGRGAASSEERF